MKGKNMDDAMKRCGYPPKPITIRVAYAWGDGKSKDDFWIMIRDKVKPVLNKLEKLSQRTRPSIKFNVRFGRLRARHGATVLGSITKRIKDADILIFDLATQNNNVCFELGCAMGMHSYDDGRIYVFCHDINLNKFSDLQGLMYTEYNGKTIKDDKGFVSALRSSIISIAHERGMWGSSVIVEEISPK